VAASPAATMEGAACSRVPVVISARTPIVECAAESRSWRKRIELLASGVVFLAPEIGGHVGGGGLRVNVAGGV